MLILLERSISETSIAYVYKAKHVGSLFSDWDSKLMSSWSLLSLAFKGNLHWIVHKVNRASIVWLPPLVGIFKLNIDGASKGNPGLSRVGVIIRDHKGLVLCAKYFKLLSRTNNEDEAQALL